MNKISLSCFNYLIVNNPFRISDTNYWTWMYLNFIFCLDTAISAITLDLSNIHKICAQYTPQYSLMNIRWWLYFINLFLFLLIFCKLISHHLLSWWESIKLFNLILKFMKDFNCMFHWIVTNFHLLAWLFLLVILSIHKT